MQQRQLRRAERPFWRRVLFLIIGAVLFAAVLCLVGCGTQNEVGQGDREAILNATKPDVPKPVDASPVSRGIDRVGDASADVDKAVSAVEAANRRLTAEINAKDAAFDRQRAAFQTLLDATNKEAAKRFRDIEAEHERKRIRYVVMVAEQKDEISKLTSANERLKYSNAQIRKHRDELVAAAAANATAVKATDKHGKAAVSVVGDVEDDLGSMKSKRDDLQRKLDKNQWKINLVNYIIIGLVLYFIVKALVVSQGWNPGGFWGKLLKFVF